MLKGKIVTENRVANEIQSNDGEWHLFELDDYPLWPLDLNSSPQLQSQNDNKSLQMIVDKFSWSFIFFMNAILSFWGKVHSPNIPSSTVTRFSETSASSNSNDSEEGDPIRIEGDDSNCSEREGDEGEGEENVSVGTIIPS